MVFYQSISQIQLGELGRRIPTNTAMEINSSNKGILFPKIALDSLVNILNPPDGLMVNDITENRLKYFDGKWRKLILEDDTNYYAKFFQGKLAFDRGDTIRTRQEGEGNIIELINTNTNLSKALAFKIVRPNTPITGLNSGEKYSTGLSLGLRNEGKNSANMLFHSRGNLGSNQLSLGFLDAPNISLEATTNRVGIGTDSPQATLHLKTTGEDKIRVSNAGKLSSSADSINVLMTKANGEYEWGQLTKNKLVSYPRGYINYSSSTANLFGKVNVLFNPGNSNNQYTSENGISISDSTIQFTGIKYSVNVLLGFGPPNNNKYEINQRVVTFDIVPFNQTGFEIITDASHLGRTLNIQMGCHLGHDEALNLGPACSSGFIDFFPLPNTKYKIKGTFPENNYYYTSNDSNGWTDIYLGNTNASYSINYFRLDFIRIY